VLESDLYEGKIEDLYPVVVPGGSDSASLDNAVEFLYQSGRSLPHVMAMLIPEAWPAIRTWTRTSAPSTSTTPR